MSRRTLLASLVARGMAEGDVDRLLQWPFANVCSDGTSTGLHQLAFDTLWFIDPDAGLKGSNYNQLAAEPAKYNADFDQSTTRVDISSAGGSQLVLDVTAGRSTAGAIAVVINSGAWRPSA